MSELLDSRAYRLASLALFALVLAAPLVGRVAGIGIDMAQSELRTPAARPALPTTVDETVRFAAAMEAHLDDVFGFRSQLVTAHSLLHLALGVSGSPRYLLGRDGWFFHRTTDDVLDQARGVRPFREGELTRWIRTMERRQRWLENRGIRFLVVIAPSKHAIYPEFLPSWAQQVGETRYEQLRQRLEQGSSLEVLDLHQPLRDAKRLDPVYFRTDGHWNDLGGYAAYREIVRWIRSTNLRVVPLSLADLELRWETDAVGTITRGLNVEDFVTESIPRLTLRGPSAVVSSRELGPGGGGVMPPTVEDTDVRILPTVMFVRDSFANAVARFLRESVRRMILVHHKNGQFPEALIEEYEPNIVIYEMVERGLIWELGKP